MFGQLRLPLVAVRRLRRVVVALARRVAVGRLRFPLVAVRRLRRERRRVRAPLLLRRARVAVAGTDLPTRIT